MRPTVMFHFRSRADAFYRAAGDLSVIDELAHAAAIGLLAIHGCIALADAALVAVEGTQNVSQDHADAARRLRSWCSTTRVADGGVRHLEWLVGRKTRFSYGDRSIEAHELLAAKVRMEQFFAWAFQAFPDLAGPRELHDA